MGDKEFATARFKDRAKIPSSIQISWLGSKGLVKLFFEASVRRSLGDRDRQEGLSAASLLFNLGHPGRGYGDFPPLFNLELPESTNKILYPWDTGQFVLVSDYEVPQFYRQFFTPIASYAESIAGKRNATIKERIEGLMETMSKLSEKNAGRRCEVVFDQSLNSYAIGEISSDGFSVDDFHGGMNIFKKANRGKLKFV